jgi:hypothetical protein
MSDRVRCLNAEGIAAFDRYLTELARDVRAVPPYDVLESAQHAEDFGIEVAIDRARNGVPFGSRLEFGKYLHEKLSEAEPTQISRNYGLWNWLSLYYFEQLCPQGDGDGARRVGPKELYLLSPRQGHRQYIYHLVRAPWLIVNDHAENAKVLLLSPERGRGSPLATRSRIFEELAARQSILNNKTLIATAQRLYFDERYGRTFFGASGGGAGSARRFAMVVQQLELTYDTRACGVDELLRLLPREFDEYKRRAAGR